MGELKSALERAMEKTGKLGSLSAEEKKRQASKRMNSQISQKDYLKIADRVIRNDGTIRALDGQVRALIKL